MPLPGPSFLRRSLTSPRNVSPFARAASTDIRPNDGPNSIDVTTGLFERSASAKRSHKPSEAESETTAHPRALARRCSSRRRTVLPQPRFPVMSMSLPGAPAPLSSPSSKSSMTDSRPMSIGGRLPAVGLKGFGFMSASSDWQTLVIVIPTCTELYHQQVTKGLSLLQRRRQNQLVKDQRVQKSTISTPSPNGRRRWGRRGDRGGRWRDRP